MRLRSMLALCVALVLTVGVATATAGNGNGGNSAVAHACQKGGWQNLVRSDGKSFANQDECVSYAAQGGTLQPKPTCTAGSENFSEDAVGSKPTTFAGGTIDTRYGSAGGVYGPNFGFSANFLYSGFAVNSFQLTFTNAVKSVQLDAAPNVFGTVDQTLTAFDATNNVVGSDTGSSSNILTLSVTSTATNIKYFTIATDDPSQGGIFFSNIVWGCN